jgi:hypothetical protein
MQRAKIVAVVHFAFLGLCWFSVRLAGPASAAELEKLNVVYSTIATASLRTWVPLEAGLYKKYGLETNLIYVAGSQAITTRKRICDRLA